MSSPGVGSAPDLHGETAWPEAASRRSTTFSGVPDSVRRRKKSDNYAGLAFAGPTLALSRILNYADIPDDVDANIGKPGYVGITARGEFQPTQNIIDARQRWLFRMVHSRRPLQEKMALFWHNHFATAYSKVSDGLGSRDRRHAGLVGEAVRGPARAKGQLELFREYALGNFRDLLINVAKDPAMLVWLDGRLNVRNQPQENFARELMELFTMGVGTFAETDVYAGGARVHWLESPAAGGRRGRSSSVHRRQPRDHGEDVHVCRFTRMAARPSRRVRPIPACRTAST